MENVIRFSRPAEVAGTLSGYVTLPAGYKKGGEKLPMIVFLHGAGEVGDGDSLLHKVRVHGIPKYFCANPDHLGLKVITLSPQCPDGMIWDHLTVPLFNWIKEAAEEFGADENKITITGLSMGGFGTWSLITTFPDFFAGAAPICGGGVPWRARRCRPGMPIRVYHSLDDGAVPYNCSVLMATIASEAGAKVSFTTYSDKGHGCWDDAYENTGLIEWLAGLEK